jgi:hypothetical protein
MRSPRTSRRFTVERGALFLKDFLRKRYVIYLAPSLLALLLSSGSCDESLPPYNEPQRLFAASIEGAYALTIKDNSMKLYVTVKNIFDETLQGRSVIQGAIEIASARDPSIKKTFSITAANIMSARGYNRAAGLLTIDAGESVRLGTSWDLVDDNGRDLRTSFFRYVSDPSCNARCLALTEDFVLTGNILLLDRTGPALFGPTVYSFCHVSQWIEPKMCPPILTDEPCVVRAPQTGQPCDPFANPGQ